MMRLFALVWMVGAVFFGSANAHESRPLHVEIKERQAGLFAVQWKIPPSVSDANRPAVGLEGCAGVSGPSGSSGPVVMRVGGSLVQEQAFRCDGDLQAVSITYPHANPSVSSLIRLHRLSGERHTRLLGPEQMRWDIPARESRRGIAYEYTKLGVKHIWGGVDHLLFLVCLIFIAGTGRRIFITVTGFTLAHSLTLVLSALQLVQLAIAPVEAVIALSIVFLATEIIRKRRDTMAWRYPIAVSASFGLLHGFGFAAVLNEIGLPQTELVTGLLFFNLGVEIGQVVFLLAVIACVKILRGLRWTIKQPLVEKTAAYAVGALASYWMIERVSGFWAV